MSDLVYSPPGVYVSEDSLAVANLSAIVSLPPSRLAIVGPSVSYTTVTEAVKLVGTTASTLSNFGVLTASVVVKSLTGTVYEITTDYTVASSGSPATEAVVTIARSNPSNITDGEVVYVTYNYADSAYFEPFVATDFDVIQARYGSAINQSTGVITSPLSFAAKLAMEQGVRELVLLPTQGSTYTQVSRQQLADAYVLLESRDDVGIVVPLPIGITGSDGTPGDTTNIINDLKAHLATTSANGLYRTAVFGYDKSATRTHSTVAATASDRRIALVYPNTMNYFVGNLKKTIEVDGFYLAAAVAGQMAARAPQDPMTRKAIRSFTSIPSRIFSTMTNSAKNTLSAAGVMVVEQTTDQKLVVRHGVSTNTTSTLTREISLTRSRDILIRLIYRALDNSGLIGAATNDETPVLVRSIVDGALNQARSSGLLMDFSNLKVKVSEADPTAMDVKFAYKPSYPLNYVNVSFSVNTVTGNTQEV